MERLSVGIGAQSGHNDGFVEQPDDSVQSSVIALKEAESRLALPERLFALDLMDVFYEQDVRTLWTFMVPAERPSFTEPMLSDIELVQSLAGSHFGPGKVPLDFLVLGSRTEGVFSFGGDLRLFSQLIANRDREGLISYGNRCVEISHRNIRALELPMLTIGLAQGQALGGGFEALLSFDFIIAEKHATFGLPEVKFGLFPGMGAHAILSRKLGTAMADRMILSEKIWTADELFQIGLVHQVVESGEGVEAVRKFINKSAKHHAGMVGSRRAMNVSAPITMQEFYHIVEIWADSALKIRDLDLKMMQRLTSAQVKLAKAG